MIFLIIKVINKCGFAVMGCALAIIVILLIGQVKMFWKT
jgi:hypothetical protein